MVHHDLQLAIWLSLRYTNIFYSPTGHPYGTPSIFYRHIGYLYDTLPSTTCLLAVPEVHYYLLLAQWPSLCYSTIFYWPTGSIYGTLPSSPSPVAPSHVTLPFSTGPLAVSMVHYYLLLANWLSLWYTTIIYWPTGYLYGIQLSSTGPLTLSRVLYYLLLAVSIIHYYLLFSHWLSL